jgi:hypothetical protein
MLFRKLFQLLVVGGAVLGATSGCSTPAGSRRTALAKDQGGGDGTASDAGTARSGDSDGGMAPDAGGGVSGW